MDIWLAVREWEGFAWLETRYEATVAGLEKEGRRVTEFLGLAWHEDQTRSYEKSQKMQLYSPTYQDVTRLIYGNSEGRSTEQFPRCSLEGCQTVAGGRSAAKTSGTQSAKAYAPRMGCQKARRCDTNHLPTRTEPRSVGSRLSWRLAPLPGCG